MVQKTLPGRRIARYHYRMTLRLALGAILAVASPPASASGFRVRAPIAMKGAPAAGSVKLPVLPSYRLGLTSKQLSTPFAPLKPEVFALPAPMPEPGLGIPQDETPTALESLIGSEEGAAKLSREPGSADSDKQTAGLLFEGSAAPRPETEIEKLRRENAELNARLEEKSRFFAKAVHDLRNPLSVVLGYAQIGLMDKEAPSFKQTRALEAITTSGKRLDLLISDILELSRAQSGEVPLRRAPLDIARLLREAARGLEAQAALRGIRIELSAPEQAPFKGDPQLLLRMIENLAGNGVKYNKDGGTLRMSLEVRPACYALIFSDDGVGIPPEELPNLFKPFFRASTSAGVPGTGLGLAGVKAVVDRHKGTVSVKSEPGAGTRFTVILPNSRD